MHQFFATCPRGLERVLEDELVALSAQRIEKTDGGVKFEGEFALCYSVNLHSRIASRVLWRVATSSYRSEHEIYEAARALPWSDWFPVESSIRVDVGAKRASVNSLDFTALRIKDAVCDAFRAACGSRPDVDTRAPDARIHAFLTASEVTLYLDTSGEPLFKRGYRRSAGDAPLRENLAAGILRLIDWDGGMPLLDPMCGSGTLLCEAAMIATDRAPGLGRGFGFEKLSRFDAQTWGRLRDEALRRIARPAQLAIYGSDRYGDALKLARANLAALDVEHAIALKQADILEMPPPSAPGALVTNPPYGVRLHDREALAQLYPKLGDVLKKKYPGWIAYIFTADLRLAKMIGLSASRRTPLYNGPLECRLFEFRIVEGSMRRKR